LRAPAVSWASFHSGVLVRSPPPPSATIGDREFGNACALAGKRHVEISILPYIAAHTNRAPALPAMHVADDVNEHQSWPCRI
jgi:hypothetical protein